ncbi:hypothetical protein F6X40_27840 [Paraburkholderia sp. UCT31]|uniref:hypothetical protein n=1 Tax=Paraburkholderia sp. UCT31 TaxID=2615209 RepID=UPI001654F1BA|nr:hypothetical protein [Paraburkholderia sp. UCT31]MBC8740452.1 hypothetical protein [Paraburkholderia sp. UCT31]
MNLKDFKDQIQPATDWFFDPTNEETETGVDGQDIRVTTGYQTGDNTPSKVHSDWFKTLKADLEAGKISLGTVCTDSKGFAKLRAAAEKGLVEQFQQRKKPTAKLISLHSTRRLVNLSLKSLRTWDVGGRPLADAIYKFGHSALNEPVVDLAEKLIPANGDNGFVYNISGNDTDAQAAQKYDAAQQTIRTFCEAHGTTPVIFDIIARSEHLKKA